MSVSNSKLHYTILNFIINRGFGPELTELAEILDCTEAEVSEGLHKLQEDHGVVLHPNSSKVWVIHPFSLAPTNFVVRCNEKEWWGNCAWCSLGIAGLLKGDASIVTTLGANAKQVEIRIVNGRVQSADFIVHFPIPMQRAWDNVIYTCSTMLIFKNEEQVDSWCETHRIAKGDVQPITKVFEFAKVWYGNHLNPNWQKWTAAEARAIFEKFDLKGPIWELPASDSRF